MPMIMSYVINWTENETNGILALNGVFKEKP